MVVFVILHYRVMDETVNCVDSILNNVEGEKRIVIVDNASPNGSGALLCERYSDVPAVEVLLSDENLGFAKGNNLGYAYALASASPDFIVVMNNDMDIEQHDFIDCVKASYEKTGFFIMGPDIYSTSQSYHQNPQTRKMPTRDELEKRKRSLEVRRRLKFLVRVKWLLKSLSRSRNEEMPHHRQSDQVNQIVFDPLLHGSCYVFSRKFIERHPERCFYDKTFMYMEAEILHYLAKRDGELMVYDPSVRVSHHEDVATNAEYSRQYEKSVFSINCLLQSTCAFIDLMDEVEGAPVRRGDGCV